ncbi:MAG: PAS domain S-box protein [Rudaea sp.]|uniref:PAS domain S-box protein n=1 Tax=Rudaea sp. TaxID=2136325 RepID=UPI0039E61BBF
MYRELFDIAPDAMIAVDGSGRIVRANAQAERLFGYAEARLLGAGIEMLIPERARHMHQAHMANYIANPRVRAMGSGQELIGLRNDGSEFPVEIALSPISTPEGRLVVAAIRDISETQRARAALARARYDKVIAQIGQLFLTSPGHDDAIARLPALVAEALAVDAVALIFRIPLRERLHVRASSGIDAQALSRLTDLLGAGLFDRLTATGRTDAVVQGGALLDAGYAASAVVPLPGHGAPASALLALSRAPRHFDHDALHFLHSIATTLAATLQRMRTEEQLSHAQRLEAVGQLTGGIAHDFNNLLTVISANLQILEDDLAGHPGHLETIAIALRAVGRGAELTRKLLAFARRQQLSPRACDPPALLEEVGGLLRHTLGEAIDLRIECAADMPRVFVDPGQLDTALVNLAINARDAMPRGGRLHIGAHLAEIDADAASGEAKPGRYVVIAVRDTGFGMAPDVLARALEPFFTTKEQGKGSGLGLSMVYGFVAQSGGHLQIESKLGYGTCVELYLPVIATTAEASAARIAPAASERGDETVLVVEDDADVRRAALAFLRSLGYTPLPCADASGALRAIAQHPQIALVFSDVMLGSGMNGVELAEEIRERWPALPVLLTSGDERSAQSGEGFDLLRKPYRREELSTAIRRKLDRPREA